MNERIYSRNGAQFVETLRTLQSDGFSNWLLRVYAAESPKFEYGAFFYDDDLEFSEVFAEVAHEFPPHDRGIAVAGLTTALSSLTTSIKSIHPFSIFALSRICMSAGALAAVPKFKPLLERMVHQNGTNRLSVIALRDTLENIMRLVFFRVAKLGYEQRKLARIDNHDDQITFGEISSWCSKLLVDDRYVYHNVPAYAPMFFLSLVYHYAFRRDGRDSNFASFALKILMDNFAMPPPWPHQDLLVYKSAARPDVLGPYNLDAIIDTHTSFIDALTRVKVSGRYESGLLQRSSPGSQVSLTHAGYTIPDDEDQSKEALEEIERQMAMA